MLVTGGLNNRRLPPYHRLDLGLNKTGGFFGIGRYELELQAINVYNRRNLWFYDLDTDVTPLERTPVRQLPILPNVSLAVRF